MRGASAHEVFSFLSYEAHNGGRLHTLKPSYTSYNSNASCAADLHSSRTIYTQVFRPTALIATEIQGGYLRNNNDIPNNLDEIIAFCPFPNDKKFFR